MPPTEGLKGLRLKELKGSGTFLGLKGLKGSGMLCSKHMSEATRRS
jgi:hypothetical protein